MPTPAILLDDLLAPISSEKPGGEDLRPTRDWINIRDARPTPHGRDDKGIWTPKNTADAGWPQLFEKTAAALKQKSKDLQIAIWLTEASTHLHGFAGLRDSLRLIRELLLQFWDSGLFPSVQDGDVEIRLGPLHWLNDKLADLILAIPITARNSGEPDYSYAYFLESRRVDGSVTAEQFDEAAKLTSLTSYENLLDDCTLAVGEFRAFEAVSDAKFGPDLISFSESKEAFEKCQAFLENAVAQRRRTSSSEPPSVSLPPGMTSKDGLRPTQTELRVGAAVSDGSWHNAEQLVRSGQIAEGLSEMTRLAATEANGRVRFHRKLLLVDICLSTNRHRLAKSILEELAELIEKHRLEEWETPEVVGGVWSRLYRCCQNEQAGIADPDQAAKLFLKLCRLDPWQALICGDSKQQ